MFALPVDAQAVCTCPSFTSHSNSALGRARTCKHIEAVRIQFRKDISFEGDDIVPVTDFVPGKWALDRAAASTSESTSGSSQDSYAWKRQLAQLE